MKITQHLLFFTLVPLLMLTACFSYYRFIIVHDYLVGFEGSCDPEIHSCFTGCNDDGCTDTYYYAKIERNAATIRRLCGADVSVCSVAETCLENEKGCTVKYCDPETDGDFCSDVLGPSASEAEASTTDRIAPDNEQSN